jgi:hypothetical protein
MRHPSPEVETGGRGMKFRWSGLKRRLATARGHEVTTERQRGANDCELKGAPHAEWSVHHGRVGGKFFAIRSYDDGASRVETLISNPGIAQISAIQLVARRTHHALSRNMTVRQWVAPSGLDPAHQVSFQWASSHVSAVPAIDICVGRCICMP